MGELSPIVVEGHLRIREGKKWKNRFARVTRLSPVADFLTLQLWRDGKEIDKHKTPTKGSMSLTDYLGCEVAFNLEKESDTLALIFRDNIIILALESREILIKWQVRLTGQFEEGQQFPVHLVSAPKKGKVSSGLVKLHLQNHKFSLTAGVPPVLLHTWNMIDLRRYGSVDGGRFCFEGGTRCGKGEGLHVFRVDNSEELQIAFDLASKGKLENGKRGGANSSFKMSHSPSVGSSLSTINRSLDSGESGGSGSPLINNGSGFNSARSKQEILRTRSRSRSRSMNTSGAWSSLDNGLALSSPDTLSLTLSEVEQEQQSRISSPEHLVSRRTILDRIGLEPPQHIRNHNGSRSCGSDSDFYLNWNVDRGGHPRRQGSVPWTGSTAGSQWTAANGSTCGTWNGTTGNGSTVGTWNNGTGQRSWNTGTMDRMSLSSGESQSSGSNYDQPKTVLKVTTSPRTSLKRVGSRSSGVTRPLSPRSATAGSTSRPLSPASSTSPSLTPRSLRRVLSQQGGELDLRRQLSGGELDLRRQLSGGDVDLRRQLSGGDVDLRRQLSGGDVDLRRQIAAAPCACAASELQGYENYDVPRNLVQKQNECMQFYDTPRNIREAMGVAQDGMGNYDIPGDPLPVFTKPCGCLLRLTGGGALEPHARNSDGSLDSRNSSGGPDTETQQDMTWTCLSEGSNEESELQIPRVKLTGHGRMPVVDMSKINAIRCLSEPPNEREPPIKDARPLSPNIAQGCSRSQLGPVYAQIDRSKKQKYNSTTSSSNNSGDNHNNSGNSHNNSSINSNYTNLEFAESLCLYENSRDVLSRLQQVPQKGEPVPNSDYLLMNPRLLNKDYETMNFSLQNPCNVRNPQDGGDQQNPGISCSIPGISCESAETDRSSVYSGSYDNTSDSMALMSDTRFDTIKHAPKPATKEVGNNEKDLMNLENQLLYRPDKDPLNLGLALQTNNLHSGYLTLPRSNKISENISNLKSQSPGVTMRRSASVPCKRDRDSGSSSDSSGGSDSGVSTGSPRQSAMEQLESLRSLDLDLDSKQA